MPFKRIDGPIRVVVFCHPPHWEWGVKRFLSMLEEHPDIQVTGIFCQADDGSLKERIAKVCDRRGGLAIPILLIEFGRGLGRLVTHPRKALQVEKTIGRLKDRTYFSPDIHAAQVLTKVESLAPDLGLIYGAPLLKPKLFTIPSRGTLGVHHGCLPKYRGVKTTFWEMYNGEPTAGVTIQRVNAGLDTGEVVKTGQLPVARKSLGRVCKELEEMGLALYLQAILEVKEGRASFVRLGHKGKVYRQPRPVDLLRFHWRRVRKRVGFGV